MPPNTTLWTLDAHTIGKHRVLESYMQAWLPIMSSWNERIVFIDAFAGPGEYTDGNPGSPVVALRSLIEHNARSRMKNEFVFLFIEKDKERYDHLKNVLESLQPQLPANCKIYLRNSTFDETVAEISNRLEIQRKQLEPALVMVDPFGIKGAPMSAIKRILSNSHAEVYISFMYRDINRFRTVSHFESGMDELIGDSDWRNIAAIQDDELRKARFFELYRDKLKSAGAKYVVDFELHERNRLVYSIFFGTQNLEGCDQMKKAIWKNAPFGDFKFRGDFVDQNMFGEEFVDFRALRRDLYNHFGSKGWVTIETVIDFVKSDNTKFHTGHLKVKTLRPMEDDNAIEVKPETRKQPRTYTNGTVLRFLRE